MKKFMYTLSAAAALFADGSSQTFNGVITDSMCVANHAMMHVTPDDKCVRECARAGGGTKYVLYDGKNVYKLSDQETPAMFAQKRLGLRANCTQERESFRWRRSSPQTETPYSAKIGPVPHAN
jgi:hypothetical protein